MILATGGYSNNQEMWEEFTKLDFDRVELGCRRPRWRWHSLGARTGRRCAHSFESHVRKYRCAGANESEDHAGWVFSWSLRCA